MKTSLTNYNMKNSFSLSLSAVPSKKGTTMGPVGVGLIGCRVGLRVLRSTYSRDLNN